ncbi:MAG TPA: HEAT repeat domain-containing protein [Anaerolineae bacterium]|nr:HEAT repeat domain-containing protein [Anaerolineae bacterium]
MDSPTTPRTIGMGQRQANFRQTLLAIQEPGHALASIDLDTLSDLSQDHLGQFRAAWATLSPERQRGLIAALIEFAEDHVDASFAVIYRWLMEDADPWVRSHAIEGLWEEEDVRLISPLIRRLQEDTDADVRAAAALSLGRFLLLGEFDQIDSSAARRVERALLAAYHRAGQDVSVRRRVLEALANSSYDELPDMILEAYEDDDDTMRIGAVFAMGRNADPRWNHYVLNELGSNDSAILFEAARASGELEIEEALPDLLRLLGDEDVEIRDAAVWALGRIGGREAKRALKVCCASDDEDLSEAAEEALAELDFMAGDDSMPSFFFQA